MRYFNEKLPLSYQDFIPPKTNIFYAIDFDGCLVHASVLAEFKRIGDDILASQANSTYQGSEAYFAERLKAIIKHNQQLLAEINEHVPLDQYRKFVTLFSNRQSAAIDSYNNYSIQKLSVEVDSCFHIFQALFPTTDRLRFIPILLTDYINDITPGTTLNRLTDSTYDGSIDRCPLDKNKVLLAYEQAHFAAMTYPKDKNIIKIYDDSVQILNNLAAYYEKDNNRNLLPSNVTLELYSYTGGAPVLLKTITGTGVPDLNYGRTLRRWVECARKNWEKESGNPIIADYVLGRQVADLRVDEIALASPTYDADEFTTPSIITTNDDGAAESNLKRASIFGLTISSSQAMRRHSSASSMASELVDSGEWTNITTLC